MRLWKRWILAGLYSRPWLPIFRSSKAKTRYLQSYSGYFLERDCLDWHSTTSPWLLVNGLFGENFNSIQSIFILSPLYSMVTVGYCWLHTSKHSGVGTNHQPEQGQFGGGCLYEQSFLCWHDNELFTIHQKISTTRVVLSSRNKHCHIYSH